MDEYKESFNPFIVLRTKEQVLILLSKEEANVHAEVLRRYHEVDTLMKGEIQDNDDEHFQTETIWKMMTKAPEYPETAVEMNWFEIVNAGEGVWLPKEIIQFFVHKVFGEHHTDMAVDIWKAGRPART